MLTKKQNALPNPNSGWTRAQWAVIMSNLNDDQRMLLELRFIASLSLRQIASVMNVDEKLVKSRLYELRQRIKREQAKTVPKPARYGQNQKKTPLLEEKIMDKIQGLTFGRSCAGAAFTF